MTAASIAADCGALSVAYAEACGAWMAADFAAAGRWDDDTLHATADRLRRDADQSFLDLLSAIDDLRRASPGPAANHILTQALANAGLAEQRAVRDAIHSMKGAAL